MLSRIAKHTGLKPEDLRNLRQNYPLQLSGATVRVAIAVPVLQVQRQSALPRAFKKTACS
jgi:hypothetical protein